jgi:hypothetical protein
MSNHDVGRELGNERIARSWAGSAKTVRATWRIANLTTRDLYGQDPALQIRSVQRNARQGHRGLAWGGPGGAKPLLGAAKRPCCGAKRSSPFIYGEANK